MAKNRSSSVSESRSKSLKATKLSSKKSAAVVNGKRRHSASPAPTKKSSKQVAKVQAKGKKVSRTPSVSPIKGRGKKVDPALEKKRKGNNGKPVAVVVVSDDEDNTTPRKKKASKVEEKAASRAANVTPNKGRGRSVTPVKLPTKKKVVQVPLPEDVADAVTQVILDNKTSKLSAPRILQLIQEAYTGATEVAVYTAIGNLFRAGLLSETKGAYTVDNDVLEQLKPPAPVVAVAAIEEEVEEPAAAADVVADAVEPNPEAMEVEAPVATGSAAASLRKSAAKEEATSVKRSVAKEEHAASAKKSVARETSEASARKSTQKSAAKTSVKKASEDFVDNVIATEDAPAALPAIAEEAEQAN